MKHPQQGCPIADDWANISDPFYVSPVSRSATLIQHGLTYVTQRSARKDLTPRQIEWCRANLSSFMPKVINAPR